MWKTSKMCKMRCKMCKSCNICNVQSLPIITNISQHCPSCRSPIEKQDGCNHVKCAKCRHDFCWVSADFDIFHLDFMSTFVVLVNYKVKPSVLRRLRMLRCRVAEVLQRHKGPSTKSLDSDKNFMP